MVSHLRYRLATRYQQARMIQYTLGHLSRSAPSNWLRNWDHLLRLARRFRAGGFPAMQRPNAEVAYVSTPIDGLGVGFTANGRVSVVMAPEPDMNHQLPYYVSGQGGPLDGAAPMAGSFAGIDAGDGLDWLWESEVTVSYTGRLPMVTAAYEGPVSIRELAYVAPGTDTLVRDFVVENPDDEARSVAFVYHTRANVTTNIQQFMVWDSSPNDLRMADELCWQDATSTAAFRVRLDRPARTLGREPGESFEHDHVSGRMLDGRLETTLELPASGQATVSVLLTAGKAPGWDDELLAQSPDERRADVAAWWNEWLPGESTSQASTASQQPGDAGTRDSGNQDAVTEFRNSEPARSDETSLTEMYHRSLGVLGALADPQSGAIPASPNLQPTYYPCWPRDSAFAAVALARAGRQAPASALLGEFLPRVQESDGSFRQCYDTDGRFAGAVHVEGDQQPLYVWAVEQVAATLDDGLRREAWPTVRDALGYVLDSLTAEGLLAPTPDIDEWPDSVRQSLWTNTWAYRGLLDGATIARHVGVDPTPYRDAVETVGDAIGRELFDDEGYVTYRDATGDHDDLHTYDAVAISPTGWAGDYGEADRLAADLRALAREDLTWIPGAGLLAAALFSRGDRAVAHDLLERICAQTTTAGHLVEVASDEAGHYYASPLAWSHAAFVLAMQARDRT